MQRPTGMDGLLLLLLLLLLSPSIVYRRSHLPCPATPTARDTSSTLWSCALCTPMYLMRFVLNGYMRHARAVP